MPSLSMYGKSICGKELLIQCTKTERLIFFRKPINMGHDNGKPETALDVIGLEASKVSWKFSMACLLTENFPLCVCSPRNIQCSHLNFVGEFSPRTFSVFYSCHSTKGAFPRYTLIAVKSFILHGQIFHSIPLLGIPKKYLMA